MQQLTDVVNIINGGSFFKATFYKEDITFQCQSCQVYVMYLSGVQPSVGPRIHVSSTHPELQRTQCNCLTGVEM